MVNKIWGFLIIIGVLYSIYNNNVDLLNEEIIKSAKQSFDLIINIFPILALWLGISKIAEKSGLLQKISKKLEIVLKFLFPTIPKNHESLGYISSNLIANMFGLGSAATPFGLKAMESLQSINKDKNRASDPMITFLVLNTSGVTIIPTSIISLRLLYESKSPTSILIPVIIVTCFSSLVALSLDYFIRRKNE